MRRDIRAAGCIILGAQPTLLMKISSASGDFPQYNRESLVFVFFYISSSLPRSSIESNVMNVSQELYESAMWIIQMCGAFGFGHGLATQRRLPHVFAQPQ